MSGVSDTLTPAMSRVDGDSRLSDALAVPVLTSVMASSSSSSYSVGTNPLGRGESRLRRRAGESGVDPGLDVRHDDFLVDVVQKIVVMALVELRAGGDLESSDAFE